MKKYEVLQEIELIDHILCELPYHQIRLEGNLSKEGYKYLFDLLKKKQGALFALSKIR